ncbi:hypothetical protein D9757_004096 [Collybiopsis confluens]|uniref:Cytochrome P450 n=1 Tax=Collybiopsis confluens TaxID=2823264 RepID=A0A8H5HUG2_9AGAR|nr:hypothetical protein D9757_004096 [Collybiopsis confluens]
MFLHSPATMSHSFILLSLASAIIYILISISHRRKSFKFLQGPPTSRWWLLGHEHELANHPERVIAWFRSYGSVFRTVGSCGQETLMVSDAEALYHILNTGGYRYPKTMEEQKLIEQRCGRGLSWVQGELAMHQRHKKALNLVFSESQLEHFLPMFQMHADKLALRWKEESDGHVIDIAAWSSKVVLDILGQASFNFQFGSLDAKPSRVGHFLQNISADSTHLSKTTVAVRGVQRIVPRSISRLLKTAYVPEEDVRGKLFEDATRATVGDFLRSNGLPLNMTCEKSLQESQRQNYLKEFDGEKDMLNVLLRLIATQTPKRELLIDDDEVLSQISTTLHAGYQFTASTLTWILYELCRTPHDQQRLRAEIDAIRMPKAGLTLNDYEAMPYLNACIKEVLRLHPGVDFITREADLDDVIPLAHPILSTSGEIMKKIPVMKGQRVQIAIGAYNRSPEIWGDDSDVWNPSRHIGSAKENVTTLGVFGNLYVIPCSRFIPINVALCHRMSFGSGVRACIGWRFAVIELQAIIVRLLSEFEFQLASGLYPEEITCTMNAMKNEDASKMQLIVKKRVL